MAIISNIDDRVAALHATTYPDPMVGTNFVHVFDNTRRVRILLIRFLLTTDANAANRIIIVRDLLSGNEFHADFIPTAQVASKGIHYTMSNVAESNDMIALSNRYQGILSDPFIMEPGSTLYITVNNKQIGDQLSDIRTQELVWLL